jgi:hypothetical protein
MDRDSAFSQTCFCGRTFGHSGAFSNHQRTCKKSKKRLTFALHKAKESIAAREQLQNASELGSSSTGLVIVDNLESLAHNSTAEHAQGNKVCDLL